MREIKFRGKRIDNDKWIYGSYVQYDKYNDKKIHLIYSIIGHPNYIKPETVSQFTELKDKTGKEIYGGDVLNYNNEKWICKFGEYNDGEQYITKKHYGWYLLNTIQEDGFRIDKTLIDLCNKSEIIGNIYE